MQKLEKKANISSIKKRMSTLNDKYLEKCESNQNHLIVDLIDELTNEIESDLPKGVRDFTILGKNIYIVASIKLCLNL